MCVCVCVCVCACMCVCCILSIEAHTYLSEIVCDVLKHR